MMMKKAFKVLGWTAAACVLLAAAGALAAKLYFTPAKLKALTTDYAQKTLRRQVTFDSAALNFSGLAITNLRVSEHPDFKRGEFFSADSFSARPSLRALLRRELKIESVSASGLKMRVAELRPETYNFSDLLDQAPVQKGPRAPQKETPAPQLSISSLKVRSSRFVYTNAAGDLTVTLKDIDLSASALSPSELFPAEAAFTLGVASPYFNGELPATLKGRLSLGGFDPQKGRAEIEQATLGLGGVKASLKGSLTNLLEPDARLSLQVKQFSTADLRTVFKGLPPKILLPEIKADTDFKLTARGLLLRSADVKAGPLKALFKGSAAWNPAVSYDFTAEIKAQVPEMDTTLLAKKARDYPVPPGLKLPLTDISAALRLKDGRAEINSFTAVSAPLDLSGSASVNFGGPALKAAGRAKASVKNLARTAEIAPGLLGPYALSGKADAALAFSYDGTPAASGRATLNGLGASFAGRKLTDLSGAVEFTMDSAAARHLAGKLDGEDFSAAFSVSDMRKHPKAAFDLKLARLVITEAPAAAAPAGKPAAPKPAAKPFYLDAAGAVSIGAVEHPNFRCGQVSAKVDLANISDDLKALDGSASFSAGPGKLSELYALAGKHKAAKVALYPLLVLQKSAKLAKGLRLPDFNNIDFELMEGDYSFAKGHMKLNKSSLRAEVADVSSSGSINLPAEKLDMKITTALKKASGISMSVPVGMFVTGTFSDPSVKPDLKSIAEQPAVKKAAQQLAPAAEKLLKGLFKK